MSEGPNMESFENKPDNMSEPHLLLCKAGQAKEQDPGTAACFRLSSCNTRDLRAKQRTSCEGFGPPNQHVMCKDHAFFSVFLCKAGQTFHNWKVACARG